MRQYHHQGVLMFALRKLSGMSMDKYPDATACELMVIIGDKYNWSISLGPGPKGPVWQCFFADVYTIGGIEDHLAGHFYRLNIVADVAAEEDLGLHNEAIWLLLRSDALSEDILVAVPLSTAAQKPWKEALRSVTKRRSFVNNNDLTINKPRGMFGDEPSNGPSKKKASKTKKTTLDQPAQKDVNEDDNEHDNEDQVVETEHVASATTKKVTSATAKKVQPPTAHADAIALLRRI